MVRRGDPGQRWLAFLENHREVIAAFDFFTVPTVTFRMAIGPFDRSTPVVAISGRLYSMPSGISSRTRWPFPVAMFFTGSALVSTAPPPKHNAGMAAEAAGDKTKARQYYTTLLKVTDNGLHSTRPEIAHASAFLVTTAAAGK